MATTLPQEFQLTKRLCGTRVGSQTTLAPTWDSTVVINHQRCLSTGSDRNGEMWALRPKKGSWWLSGFRNKRTNNNKKSQPTSQFCPGTSHANCSSQKRFRANMPASAPLDRLPALRFCPLSRPVYRSPSSSKSTKRTETFLLQSELCSSSPSEGLYPDQSGIRDRDICLYKPDALWLGERTFHQRLNLRFPSWSSHKVAPWGRVERSAPRQAWSGEDGRGEELPSWRGPALRDSGPQGSLRALLFSKLHCSTIKLSHSSAGFTAMLYYRWAVCTK